MPLVFVFVDMSQLSLEDVDSVSEAERDTLAPLPPPAWNNYTYGPPYMPPPPPGGYIPPAPYGYSNDTGSYVSLPIGGEGGNNGSAGSVHSGSGGSTQWVTMLDHRDRVLPVLKKTWKYFNISKVPSRCGKLYRKLFWVI